MEVEILSEIETNSGKTEIKTAQAIRSKKIQQFHSFTLSFNLIPIFVVTIITHFEFI
jgi:hypothetical protein